MAIVTIGNSENNNAWNVWFCQKLDKCRCLSYHSEFFSPSSVFSKKQVRTKGELITNSDFPTKFSSPAFPNQKEFVCLFLIWTLAVLKHVSILASGDSDWAIFSLSGAFDWLRDFFLLWPNGRCKNPRGFRSETGWQFADGTNPKLKPIPMSSQKWISIRKQDRGGGLWLTGLSENGSSVDSKTRMIVPRVETPT